jgi:hypothetical protein
MEICYKIGKYVNFWVWVKKRRGMFKKKLWEEIYVLCNELVRNLAKVR